MPINAKTELTNLSTILTLFHHRNKNQHRLAKWYKSLSILHRQIPKLLSSLETYHAARELKEKSKYTTEAREKLVERVEFMGRWVLGRCYLAFSTLVADNQYAALGLLLVGVLARLRTVVKMLGKELGVEIEMGEIEKSVSEGIEEVLEMKEGGDDFGEVISRGAIEVGVGGNVVEALDEDQVEEPALRMSKKEKKRRKQVEEVKVGNEVVDSTSSKRPKKKRKKGDAFDDLFSSLV
ncbi:Ribonuclease MRP protein subunit rmp1 [Lachnellula hyalina]|uniref:Ribonuclease MRP protein subunit rmp1 n=1 Tax=Lachnellula hyalina TaxID=1316788 RepID=A0A8H8R6K3_9HELO|nr:Ribonuclease MRP protein subunit rmp1 [Lachnellula hyalina]TVY28625.1 Ribonuclease MRP protein subunit rmp1 [Lachnellula hyalina]